METQAGALGMMSDPAGTVPTVMPKSKVFLVNPHVGYLKELRRRIKTGAGMTAVAKEAGIARITLWRLLNGGGDRDRPTVEAAERVRAALAALDPKGEPMPPVVVAVRDQLQHDWIKVGETLRRKDPDRFAELLAELQAPGKRRKR